MQEVSWGVFSVICQVCSWSFHQWELVQAEVRAKPILDYDVEQVSNEMKLIPVYVEQGHSLVFTFVRSDGNLRKLKEILYHIS